MVRTEDAKLVRMHGDAAGDGPSGELYDLADDPGEVHNRWNDPAAVDQKVTLLETLSDRMAETVDPLPERQAAW